MSRVYFHSPSGEAELRGSERAYAGSLCHDLLVLAMGAGDAFIGGERDPLVTLVPPGHYLHALQREHFRRSFRTWLHVGNEPFAGVDISPFVAALNTAAVLGSDTMRLLARVHGQCEVHGWVDGPHRVWLAELIVDGREDHVLRDDMGWEGVATLLRARDDEPVVMSYSVCRQFPNWQAAGWETKDEGEDWYALPAGERWARAMAGLRALDGLELEPNSLALVYSPGLNGFDLSRIADERSAALAGR
jgi:hypothetical protein